MPACRDLGFQLTARLFSELQFDALLRLDSCLKEVWRLFSELSDAGSARCHVLPQTDSHLSAIPKVAGYRFVFVHA